MNARWFRDNLSVLLFSVAFLIILGVLIWFLRAAAAEQATVVQELETKRAELQRLQSSKIFPSVENIDVLKRDQEQIRRLYGLLQNAALRDEIQPPELEREIDFALFVRATIARLTAAANQNNIRIGEGFAWGFSRYVATIPCKNPPLKSEDCKRLLHSLAKQFLIIEKIAGLLIESRVEAINSIRRTEIESGTSNDTLNVPIGDDPKLLYRTYPFEIQFSGDTESFRRFLNALAQANQLYIIRTVRIGTVVQQVQAPARPVPVDLKDFDLAKPPESPKMIETRRLNVTLRLDLVEFKPVETKPAKR